MALLCAATFAASTQGGCDPDDGRALDASCPNEIPSEGGPCEPGLVCSYADPTGCRSYFVARCSESGQWVFEGTCQPVGGGGTGGATTGTGGFGGTGTGGTGLAGGSGGCDDANAGPPAVVSTTSATYPPDTLGGAYRLELDEPVIDLASYLVWSGPGGIDGVSKIGGQVYRVRFSGVAPGEGAILSVAPGLQDNCGNALDASVDISLEVLPRCHLLGEDFAGDFLTMGWTSSDEAGDGNRWMRNDELDPPGGVPNHTAGLGNCAAADDSSAGLATRWDSSLDSPLVDLFDEAHVVLSYEGAFDVPSGAGQAWLEASDDGMSWQTLGHWTASHGPSREVVDVSAFGGGPLALRWRYSDDDGAGGYWNVDDVCVESYTQASCSCPGGGITETKDVLGVSNGNGTLGTAEQTGIFLHTLNDKVTACGRLEDSSTSGADTFAFGVATSPPGGSLAATLHYCIENSLQDATLELWEKSTGLPAATLATLHAEGDLDVTLVDGETYYLALHANALGYEPSRYTLSVTIAGTTSALLAEGFESWPPLALTVTDDDLCLDWAPATQTVVPPGGLPTEGSYLAYFNSYDCNEGSESLQSAPLDLTGTSAVMLTFDMYHDPGYASSYDNIQIQVDVGAGWLDVGLPFDRPATVAGWVSESLDLSAFAGEDWVRIGLRATTQYGNNIHIDNVKLEAN